MESTTADLGTVTISLQEQHGQLMTLIANEPTISEVAEVMKRYKTAPYAVFVEETTASCLASGANR